MKDREFDKYDRLVIDLVNWQIANADGIFFIRLHMFGGILTLFEAKKLLAEALGSVNSFPLKKDDNDVGWRKDGTFMYLWEPDNRIIYIND